jgi:hypothetical protein
VGYSPACGGTCRKSCPYQATFSPYKLQILYNFSGEKDGSGISERQCVLPALSFSMRYASKIVRKLIILNRLRLEVREKSKNELQMFKTLHRYRKIMVAADFGLRNLRRMYW